MLRICAVEARASEVPNVLVIMLLAPIDEAWMLRICPVDAKKRKVPNVLVIMLFAPMELAWIFLS